MKFYVYELVRVSDGKILYVGKGSGNRIKAHRTYVKHLLKTGSTWNNSQLYPALANIIRSGDDFTPKKVFESDDEIAALRYEIDLIQHYGKGNLLNTRCGSSLLVTISEKAYADARSLLEKAYADARSLLDKISPLWAQDFPQDRNKKLLSRVISTPSADDFKWGNANFAPDSRFLNFIFSSTS